MNDANAYQYIDPLILGFIQTQMNELACRLLSDVLLLPCCKIEIKPSLRANFYSSSDKAKETNTPGYSRVCQL